MTPDRVSLRDAAGHAVLTYLPGSRDGLPLADEVQLAAPVTHAAVEVLRQLPGWLVSAPPVLGRELAARRGQVRRHALTMARALDPVRDGQDPSPPPGLRFVSCSHPARAIQPGVTAAFPPGHPDHASEPDPAPDEPSEVEQLLAGTLAGPLLACSRLAVDQAGRVVAGCLVNESGPVPWITLMYRDPATSPPGTGSLLLAAVITHAARDGLTVLGLAVTVGNPAQRIYQRAGFTVTSESITVLIPQLLEPDGAGQDGARAD